MYYKKQILVLAFAAFAPIAFAAEVQSESTTATTTTNTEGSGTITEYAPGETIVLKESGGPVHYRIRKGVTYVSPSGKAITEEEVRSRVRVGAPVRVHYLKEGDQMVVDRVIVEEP